MRQSSTIQSSAQAMSVPPLNPVLDRVLAGLDVQLEDELIRYRRQRALGKAGYPVRQVSRRKPVPPIDLLTLAGNDVPSGDGTPAETASPDPAVPEVPFEAAIADSPSEQTAPATSAELRELAKQYAEQVADSASEANSGDALEEITPDDYLESSEELLKSLAQKESEIHAEQGFLQSLLTPLGMGSMLLLLLSSAMFGFVVMNPSSLSHLLAGHSTDPGDNAANPNAANSGAGESASGAGESLAADAIAPQPNLASQEFPDLNLKTLGTVATNGTAKAAPVAGNPAVPMPTGDVKTANIGASGSTADIPSPSLKAGPVTSALPGATSRLTAPTPAQVPPPSVSAPRQLAPAPQYDPPARASAPPPPARSYNPPPVQSYNPPPVRSYNPPPPVRHTPVRRAPETLPPIATPLPPVQSVPVPVAPRAATPAPASSPVQSRGSSYDHKVTVPFSGDRSLEEAQRQAPNAFLRNTPDGAVIQLGAYRDEAAAKARVEELRKQGVPAEVYKP